MSRSRWLRLCSPRTRRGEGQIVDVSATQCLASLAEQSWVEYSATGETMERLGSRGGVTALAGALPCADGHWMISVPPDPRGWTNFVELVPDPAFKDDHALADEALRRERKEEILERIAVWSTKQKKNEIVEEAQRRHIPATVGDEPARARRRPAASGARLPAPGRSSRLRPDEFSGWRAGEPAASADVFRAASRPGHRRRACARSAIRMPISRGSRNKASSPHERRARRGLARRAARLDRSRARLCRHRRLHPQRHPPQARSLLLRLPAALRRRGGARPRLSRPRRAGRADPALGACRLTGCRASRCSIGPACASRRAASAPMYRCPRLIKAASTRRRSGNISSRSIRAMRCMGIGSSSRSSRIETPARRRHVPFGRGDALQAHRGELVAKNRNTHYRFTPKPTDTSKEKHSSRRPRRPASSRKRSR